jgi:hypothetical protein
MEGFDWIEIHQAFDTGPVKFTSDGRRATAAAAVGGLVF